MFWNARHERTVVRRRRLAVEVLEGRVTPTSLPPGFSDTLVASGISGPTAMEFAPDGRLFVLEQAGNVKLVHSDGTTFTALHLSVDSAGERGVLGIAFDPNFASNHFVYLYYTNPNAGGASWATGEHNQLSRFTVNDTDPTRPTFGSEAPILDWNNLSGATNHNGGAIHFGADGMLYADAGDNVQTFTGPDGNTYRVSQTLGNLLGKQLRIDVGKFNSGAATRDDTTVGHLIPSDNPFVGTAGGINQLIYALGLRNPYTFAVQPGTGKIFINDVGENTWEEIDQSVAGGNYGWQGGNTDGFGHPPPSFAAGTYHDPLLAYSHAGPPGGIAIVGGTFYNPTTAQFPASYVGKYFYEDLGSGWIRTFDPANSGSAANPDTSTAFATGTPGGLRDLKVDAAGNLYYLAGGDGTVHKISYTASSGVAILDDSSPSGFGTTAGWTQFNNPGYNGEIKAAPAGTGSSVATWTFTLPPGQYQVSATWYAFSNRATNAPYTVLDGTTALGTVRVNQQLAPADFSDQGFGWKTLGTYNVTGNTLVVQLSNDANQFVIADAIRVEFKGALPSGPVAQVSDGGSPIPDGGSDSFGTTFVGTPVTRTFTVKNAGTTALTLSDPIALPAGFALVSDFGTKTLAAGASTTFQVRLTAAAAGSYSGTLSFGTNDPANNPYAFTVSGSVSAVQFIDDSSPSGFSATAGWTQYANPGYNGEIKAAPAGTGSSVATYTFAVAPGQYQVSATWYAFSNRATNAPYTVLDGATPLGTVRVNQQLVPSDFTDQGFGWKALGPYNITGNTLVVQLSNDANQFVIADAIRVEFKGALPSGPAAQVFDGSTAVANGGSDSFGTTFVGTPVTKTFTVKNAGSTSLTLSDPITLPAGFSLASDFGTKTLAAGASTTFQVRLTAAAAGSYSGTLSFGTNDPANNPYAFTVSGTVSAVQVIDDSSPSGFGTTAGWTQFNNPGYNGEIKAAPAGTGSSVATWTFAVAPGQYQVSATWYAFSNRATNAPYTVLDGTTALGTVRVNQQLAPADFTDAGFGWKALGTFTVTGNTLVVQLSNNADGFVIADAIRIQRIS